ncbi:MAG: hypothetical protein AAGD43_35610 [Pseudomonadota bacterium]
MSNLTDGDRLKLLLDYTKFHIGMYTAIITILLGLVVIGVDQQTIKLPESFRVPILLVVTFLALAGAFAGMVAAPIPNHGGDFDSYWNGPARFMGSKIHFLPVRFVAVLEHLAFWIAILTGIASVAFSGYCAQPPGNTPRLLCSFF